MMPDNWGRPARGVDYYSVRIISCSVSSSSVPLCVWRVQQAVRRGLDHVRVSCAVSSSRRTCTLPNWMNERSGSLEMEEGETAPSLHGPDASPLAEGTMRCSSKRLAPTYTWQTGSGTIFQDIVSGSRYLFYAPVVVVVAVSLEIRLIEFRYLCTRIMKSFSSSSFLRTHVFH